MTDDDRSTCAALAGLLRAAALLAGWAFALMCMATLVLALTARSLPAASIVGFGAAVVLGLLERYFAVRLRYDEAVFDGLARGTVASLQSLDHALAALGLREASCTRPLAERVQGTRRLMRWHAIVVACQSAMFLFGLMAQDIS